MDKDIGSYTLSVGAHQSRFALLQRAETEEHIEVTILSQDCSHYDFKPCRKLVLGSLIAAGAVIAGNPQVPSGHGGYKEWVKWFIAVSSNLKHERILVRPNRNPPHGLAYAALQSWSLLVLTWTALTRGYGHMTYA